MVKKGWFLLGTILEVPYPLQMTMTTDNHRRDLQQTNDAPEKHFIPISYCILVIGKICFKDCLLVAAGGNWSSEQTNI